jgi:hypothetical protein
MSAGEQYSAKFNVRVALEAIPGEKTLSSDLGSQSTMLMRAQPAIGQSTSVFQSLGSGCSAGSVK